MTPKTSAAHFRDALKRSARVLAPPPRLTLSEWADRSARLSPEDSAMPGQWVTESYQREPMDAMTDPLVEDIVLEWASQTGKTAILKNAVGYYIDQESSPILMLQPTLDMAQSFSKDRFAPMLRDTPCLRGKVKDARSRDSGNTVLHKTFPGGHVTFAGANSPASLASRPIRILICDEVDRYPASAGTEGSPVKLARKRTVTFWNRKRVYTSTPVLEDGPIHTMYEASSRGKFHVPCPECGLEQVLVMTQVKWPKGERPTAENVWYECLAGCHISGKLKPGMIRAGRWVHETPEAIVRGYHINQLYSPAVAWHETAQEFIDAKHGGVETLKTFVNTALAEPWTDNADRLSASELEKRKEPYAADVPNDAVALTCGVDVQHNRIEYEIVGWGEGYESWSIAKGSIHGEVNPEKRRELLARGEVPSDPWTELDGVLRRTFIHETGVTLRVVGTMVDSSDGAMTQHVYNFCAPRSPRRIWACKGVQGLGAIVPQNPSKQRNGALLWPIHVNTAKEHIYAALKIEVPGPSFAHFPDRAEYDAEFFAQLTAEVVKPRTRNGFIVREWVKKRARNEALDCRVYAMAALEACRLNLPQCVAEINTAAARLPQASPSAKAAPPSVLRQGRRILSGGITL